MNGWRTLIPNAWYVAVREYRSRVRSRSFIIGTILLATLAFVAMQTPVAVDSIQSTAQTKVEVVTRASSLPSDAQVVLDGALNGAPAAGSSQQKSYVLTWLAAEGLSSAQKDLEAGK